MSQLEVDKVIPQSGTTLTLGESGDTISVPSGATLDASSATVTIPAVNLTTGVTGTLPVANGGTNLSSGFANGITMADQWRLTADLTSNGNITSNLERNDSTGYGGIGTGMTESSGVFSFPSTGIYLITANIFGDSASGDNVGFLINISTDNFSTQSVVAATGLNYQGVSGASASYLFDVTDISTHKVLFEVFSIAAGSGLRGDTTSNETHFTFIRLGDT